MVSYSSHKERKLLQLNECSIRGRSPQYSGLEFDTEDETLEFPWSETSEEDWLHSIDVPTPLHSLPSLLNPLCASYETFLQAQWYKRAKESKRIEALDVLRDYIFTQPKYIQYSGRLESSLVENQMNMLDINLFLDYLPILRSMAVHERISDSIYHIQDVSNPNAIHVLSKRKPNTRQSKRHGREHYFDKVIPSYVWEKSKLAVKEIGHQLAEMSLLYQLK
jgi:hypothetical protein